MTDNLQGSDVFSEFFNLNPEEPAKPAEPKEETTETETEEAEVEEVETEEEAEEAAEETESEPKKYTIKAGGEMHELTEEQLIEHAQKGIGFYKNSEAQAREHKAALALLDEDRSALKVELDKAQTYLDILGESEAGKKHLDYLLEYDVAEYKRITGLQADIKANVQQAKEQADQAQVNSALDLLETSFPAEWAKPDTRKQLLDDGAAFLASIGLEPQQIAQIRDGATFVAAIKAKRYDELVKKAKETKANPPPKKQIKKVAQKAAPAAAKSISDIDAVDEFFPFLK